MNSNSQEIKLQIKSVLNTLLKAQEDGNWEAFKSCFYKSENVTHIGTDMDEIWIGWEAFESWMKHIFKIRQGLQIFESSTRIETDKNNTTAWYYQLIDTCIETKSETTRIEGFRHTGVMLLINDKWQIVQSHISAPITEQNNLSELNIEMAHNQ
ncbi:MAG: nuclear transport factor 2 family protein [Marinilabiliaceae bacterium]|nr:nuclear transport factor 2 family protein [Marinilabiliaceae bacterium]